MALGGVYSDHYKDVFKDVLLHEAQQNGSRLEQVSMVESMEGNKTFFDKLGKVAHRVKTSRNEDDVYADQTFERRQVQEQLAQFATLLDREDLIKHVSNPKSELVRAATMELGRRKDEVIMDAMAGNAVVTTDGSAANQALTLSVAVDNHTYDSGSGDVGLTSGKLKRAMREIAENYGTQGMGQRLICIAPSKQLANLTTENQQVSGDFRGRKPLEGPGIVQGLSGFMGIDFIEYEDVKVDASSDERVMLLTDDAMKLGVYEPLTISVDKHMGKVANPDRIKVWEALGAVRMYEEKVCEILCDPLA
jgi:hypothetical protein